MQSAQVLLVHTSYPPVLDRVKSVKQDGLVDFLELKSYKQWKPTDGEGTSKKLKEGVARSFDLIKNAIKSNFAMQPQARVVLLDLVTEFKMLFHKLLVMEVNLVFTDLAGIPLSPNSVEYWRAWGTSHLFFCHGVDNNLSMVGAVVPPGPNLAAARIHLLPNTYQCIRGMV